MFTKWIETLYQDYQEKTDNPIKLEDFKQLFEKSYKLINKDNNFIITSIDDNYSLVIYSNDINLKSNIIAKSEISIYKDLLRGKNGKITNSN